MCSCLSSISLTKCLGLAGSQGCAGEYRKFLISLAFQSVPTAIIQSPFLIVLSHLKKLPPALSSLKSRSHIASHLFRSASVIFKDYSF
jgi:hypothetical protein